AVLGIDVGAINEAIYDYYHHEYSQDWISEHTKITWKINALVRAAVKKERLDSETALTTKDNFDKYVNDHTRGEIKKDNGQEILGGVCECIGMYIMPARS